MPPKRKYSSAYTGMGAKRFRSTSVPTSNPSIAAYRRSKGVRANYRPSSGFIRNSGPQAVTAELKVMDLINASYAIENTGTQLALLNGCAPGSNNFNRIGRKLQLKSLQIHGSIASTDGTTLDAKFRMAIVYDKQANGAAPTYSDIFTSQDISGVTNSTTSAMVNLNNRDRFEIIRDTFLVLGGKDTTATQSYSGTPTIVPIDMFIALNNRVTIYNAGTAGTVGDITSGSLYVFFIATQANTTGGNFIGSFRTRFSDS